MSASPGRVTALKVISRVRERRAYAHETLDAVLNATPGLDVRDRAFATRVAYGVIATAGTLDEALDRFLDRPSRVEPRVRDALEIAAWEILFGGADIHVAVSEGVELARSVRSQAASLANAVLRRLADASDTFPWGDPTSDHGALARLYGHPLWMTERLVDDLGRPAAESVLAADNEPAPVYLAHLPFRGPERELIARLESAGAGPSQGPLPGSIQVDRPAALATSAVLASCLAEVCDAGAQFAAFCVRPGPGMRIVEIGAGRGTKTLLLQALAHRAGGQAEIWAVDSHAFKLDVLSKRAAELGVNGIHLLVADATHLPVGEGLPPQGGADVVLLDAPCSGLGTLRRHPDKRWRLRPQDIDALAALGAHMLEQSALLVSPGGFVVYSTCTLTRRENRGVVEGFLESSAGKRFVVDDLASEVPAAWRRFVAEEGWFQSVPEIGGPDGHFVARLRRE